MPRFNYVGQPGETWTNDTGKVQYQFHADWRNTCGLCGQLDSQIGSSWPIPLHRGCRCSQTAVYPGQTAEPFTDFRETIRGLDPEQQARVVGVSNLKLIESGVVDWSDVVTRARIRDLNEVVARHKLTVADLTEAGVSKHIAEEAYRSVHTPAHQLAATKRQELMDRLTAKGLEKADVRRALAERLAVRVGITGPSGASQPNISPGTPMPPASSPVPVPKPKPSPKPKSSKKKVPPSPMLPTPMIAGGGDAPVDRAYLASLGVKPEAINEKLGQPVPPTKAPEPRPTSDYKRFTKISDMESWGKAHFGEWAESVDPYEAEALGLYGTTLYKWMNGQLRGRTPDEPIPLGRTAEDLAELSRHAAKALNRAEIPAPVTGFRGVQDLSLIGVSSKEQLIPGLHFTEQGFSSVSLDESIGLEFATKNNPPTPTLFEVRIDKGMSGGYLNAGEFAEAARERELLFPPGAEYRVLSVDEIDFEGQKVAKVVVERVK